MSKNVDQEKKEIFKKVKAGEWSYEDVLSLDEKDYSQESIVAAKKWADQSIKKLNAKIAEFEDVDQIRVIRRVPFSEDPALYPRKLNHPVGDEITVVFLDVETTGLSHETDKLIELGLVKIRYSPQKQCITSVDLVVSEYQDPGIQIPPEITKLTGISNEHTDGRTINIDQVRGWLENENSYVIAHNAKFDRTFFNNLMGGESYRWGCSATQIDWKSYEGFAIESAKLEYILLKLGFFYTGHRASIDCLAMVQMFISLPQALADLLARIDEDTYRIEATGAPFDVKDELKKANYRWNPDKKVWSIEVPDSALKEALEKLDKLDGYSRNRASHNRITARDRFKII